ncbi:MAG: hypothetical protein ABJG47_10755 [Ekhidna sp.]
MKLRIRGNSIRIRLMQGEVKQFAEEGLVSETVEFPGNVAFTYSLKVSAGFEASFQDSHMEFCIPKNEANPWIASNEDLALTASFDLVNGNALKLLVEKDLACLTVRDGEDESDAFPNPKSNC